MIYVLEYCQVCQETLKSPFVTSEYHLARLFRLETLSEDLDYIGLVAGVTFSPVSSHVSGENTSRLSVEYFQQQGLENVEQLF